MRARDEVAREEPPEADSRSSRLAIVQVVGANAIPVIGVWILG